MNRAIRLQFARRGQSDRLMPAMGLIRPIAAVLASLILWILTTSPGFAQRLPETEVFDAQFAPGVLEQSETSKEVSPLGDRIQALIPDADDNCLRIIDQPIEMNQAPRTEAQHHLQETLRQIQKSEVGAWLVRIAAASKVTLCLDQATKLEAHYRSHLGLLGLSARLGPAGRVVFLAHELAHVPQHPRYSNNRRFSPEDMLLLQQVREAAAEAVATRVLWQLKQQGISAPWQAKLATAYHDIARSFEATMADGEGLVRELWATRSAFHHWFVADWRREIYDDLMFKTLARIAKDPIGLVPTSRQLTDQYLRGVAEYAGQGFLIGGDGQALIQSFRARGLPASGRARLEAIVSSSGTAPDQALSSLASDAVSAVSQLPVVDAE